MSNGRISSFLRAVDGRFSRLNFQARQSRGFGSMMEVCSVRPSVSFRVMRQKASSEYRSEFLTFSRRMASCTVSCLLTSIGDCSWDARSTIPARSSCSLHMLLKHVRCTVYESDLKMGLTSSCGICSPSGCSESSRTRQQDMSARDWKNITFHREYSCHHRKSRRKHEHSLSDVLVAAHQVCWR
jgi:hypothetical protein